MSQVLAGKAVIVTGAGNGIGGRLRQRHSPTRRAGRGERHRRRSYLLSDLSHGITGQAVSIRDGQIAILLHPQFSSYVVERQSWSVEALAEAFDETLRVGLQPYTVGVAAGTKNVD